MSKIVKPEPSQEATTNIIGKVYALTPTDNSGIALGKGALDALTGASNEVIAIGNNAMGNATVSQQNIGIGTNSLYGVDGTLGYGNVAIGENSLYRCQSQGGNSNVAIGNYSMYYSTTGYENVAIGRSALFNIAQSYQNTAVGMGAMSNGTGFSASTAVGWSALQNTNQWYNTAIGAVAGALMQNGNPMVDLTNVTAVGYGARVSASNQIQMGNSSTSFYAYGAYNNRSDIRDKADVKDTSLGLEFINKIRPVEFKWDYREDYQELVQTENEDGTHSLSYIQHEKDGSKTRNRYHQGVIAQEVKAVMDELGVDFAGYQDHLISDGNDVLTIGYTEFIAPLIKAIQELTARVEALEAK